MIKQIIHSPSRRIVVWLFTFVIGVVVASFTPFRLASNAWALGALTLALALGFFIKHKATRFVVVCGTLFSVGFLRYICAPVSSSTGPLIPGVVDWLIGNIQRLFPEPHAGFLAGLLTGKKLLSSELRALFVITGTAHVMALSGWNIGLITKWLERILRAVPFARRTRLMVVTGCTILFVVLVGASASLIRAALMGLIMVLALATGRPRTAGRAVLHAVAVMLALNPTIIRTDLGFLLSVSATLGLIYLTPICKSLFGWLPDVWGLRENAANTVAATIATLPIILIAFGQFSFVALPTNLLLLPFVPITMLVGFLAALAGVVFAPLGHFIGFFAYHLIAYDLAVVTLLSRIPGASVSGVTFNTIAAVLMVAGIIFVVRYASFSSKKIS